MGQLDVLGRSGVLETASVRETAMDLGQLGVLGSGAYLGKLYI